MKTNRHTHITDAELLELYAADGNSEWLGILLERYTLLLFGVCMKYLKDEEEAKDAVQQVFLKVLGEAGKYKIEFFKSWVYMVAKNHCLMKLRSQQGKYTKEINERFQVAAPDESKSELLENEKTYTLLEEAMLELSKEQQQCVTLFYLQKHSYQQVAQLTGYSLLQVKSYIQNGKRNLKLLVERKLKERGPLK
ncbi:MAG TPA: sigma-70 family RNA polymerase sigma factor [Flavisolibacter sp.]